MADFSSVFAAAVGLFLLLYRLQPWRQSSAKTELTEFPFVSIIVPCRNEAQNLPQLLDSIENIDYDLFELILVDDCSADETLKIAKSAQSRLKNLTVVQTSARPNKWTGKNWACCLGAEHARGSILLFTDADTFHQPMSLRDAVSFLQKSGSDLISAVPFHRCEISLERWIGSFYLFPLIAGAYLRTPTRSRLFAIGQYLLFRKAAYDSIGGHLRVIDSLTEDIDIARACLADGLKYQVYPETDLYNVQMYRTVREFIAGWIRLLRVGIRRSHILSTVEVALCINAVGFCVFRSDAKLKVIGICSMSVVYLAQTKLGKFSRLSAILAPIGAWAFCLLTLRALFDQVCRKSIVWKERRY